MALGTPVDVKPIQSFHHGLVRPTQIIVPWVEIIRNGGVETQDNASEITEPTGTGAQINNATTSILKVGKAGTKLRLRLKYDDAITTFSTSPVFMVFGRNTINKVAQPWQRLVNLCGNTLVTIDHDKGGSGETVTDVTDGADMYTQPHPADHTFDLDGCDEIIVGVITIIVVAAGDATLVSLWAKVI